MISCDRSSGPEDAQFDETVGHVQDILFEDGLAELQREFMDKHYHHFEDKDENKFIYTDIHKEYVSYSELVMIVVLSDDVMPHRQS